MQKQTYDSKSDVAMKNESPKKKDGIIQAPQQHRHQPQKMSSKNKESLSWVYINGLGEREQSNVTESDVLTAISFDKTGNYIAVGDRGGRVIIFKYLQLKNSRYFDYRYYTEIQSHEPEFDHLKSIELEEKISYLEFL